MPSTAEELAGLPDAGGFLQDLLSPLILASNLGRVGGSNVLTGIRNALGGNGNYAVPDSLSELAGLSPGSGISDMATGRKFAGSSTFEGLMRDATENRGGDYGLFMERHPIAHTALDMAADPLGAVGGLGGMAKGRALLRLADTAAAARPSSLADKVARTILTGMKDADLPQAGRGIGGITDPIRKAVDREEGVAGFLNDLITLNPGTRSYFGKKPVLDNLNPFARTWNEDLYLYGKGALQAPRYIPGHGQQYDSLDETLERFSQMPGVSSVKRNPDNSWEARMTDGTIRHGKYESELRTQRPDGDYFVRGYVQPTKGEAGNMDVLFTGDASRTTPRHEYLHTLQKSGRFSPEEVAGLRNEYARAGGTGDEGAFQEWVAERFEEHQAGQGSGAIERLTELTRSLFANQGLPTMRRTFGRVMEGEQAGRKAAGLEDLARQHSLVNETANMTDAQRDMLITAKQMDGEGVDRESIWRETGWVKTRTRGWVREISDKNMMVTKVPQDRVGSLKLGESLSHPELFAAHPGLAHNVDIQYAAVPDGGERGNLASFAGLGRHDGRITIEEPMTKKEYKHSLLHELQHAIQHEELSPENWHAERGALFGGEYMLRPGEVEARTVTLRNTLPDSLLRNESPVKTAEGMLALDKRYGGARYHDGRPSGKELGSDTIIQAERRMAELDRDIAALEPARRGVVPGSEFSFLAAWDPDKRSWLLEELVRQRAVWQRAVDARSEEAAKYTSRQYSLGKRSTRDREAIRQRIADRQQMSDLDRLRVKLQLHNRILDGMDRALSAAAPGPALRAEGEFRAALTAHRGIREVVDENAQGVLVDRIAGAAVYDPLTGRTTVHPALSPGRASAAVQKSRRIQRDMSWRDHKVELPDESGTMHEVVAGKLARDLTNRVVTLKRLQECLAS